MKIAYYISVSAAALSLVLAIIILGVGSVNQGLQAQIQVEQAEIQKQQAELQKQQEQINTAQQIQQRVGPALLQDMAQVSVKSKEMKALLAKHGYSVSQATPAPGGGAAAPPFTPAPGNFPGGSEPSLR